MSESLLILDLPIKTVSEINRRDHWRARHDRKVAQQREVHLEWKAKTRARLRLPCRVTLTRVGPKELDDDNLRSAFKNIRDEVARLLGVDDSPASLAQFDYRQHAVGKRQYRVIIEVVSS